MNIPEQDLQRVDLQRRKVVKDNDYNEAVMLTDNTLTFNINEENMGKNRQITHGTKSVDMI